MSEADPNSGDITPDSSGNPDPSKDPSTKDTVSYESHKKLLDEKKAIQKRLEDFEKKAKEDKDAELRQKEQFKELYETIKKEKDELGAKLAQKEKETNDYRKMGAFLKNVEGDVPQQYWALIDLDKIMLDDSGSVDQGSVKKAVKDFQANFPEVIRKAKSANMPNDAAGGSKTALTHEEWIKLPYAEKKKRMGDVKLD